MRTVEISWKTIVFAILLPLSLYLLWVIQDLIFSLFIAFILMSALKPGVVFLTDRKFPRMAAVLTIFLTFIFCIVILLSLIFPPIINETIRLSQNLPLIMEQIEEAVPNIGAFTSEIDLQQTVEYLPDATTQAVALVGGLLSNTFFVISTLFFAFYFLLEENLLRSFLSQYLDEKTTEMINDVFEKSQKRMSAWFWGEITLMTVVGITSYVAFLLIGLKFALPLAVIAGLLEIVPNVGPTIAAIPAILIGLSQSPLTALLALIVAIVIQQAENALIVPVIMKRAVGINPIVTLLALFLGGRLGGVKGVLLAIPIFLLVETVITEVLMMQGKKVKSDK